MARRDCEEEAERQYLERRSRRLLRKRHLSKAERCELAELRCVPHLPPEPPEPQPEAGE